MSWRKKMNKSGHGENAKVCTKKEKRDIRSCGGNKKRVSTEFDLVHSLLTRDERK